MILFRDADDQNRRGKPEDVRACEIWVRIGAPPATLASGRDPEDMRYVATDSATPHTLAFSSADAGKTAYYAVRWIGLNGGKGPWGETVEATIGG